MKTIEAEYLRRISSLRTEAQNSTSTELSATENNLLSVAQALTKIIKHEQESIRKYTLETSAHLHKILSQETATEECKLSEITKFLQSNYTKTATTNLTYTRIPNAPITLLLCDLATDVAKLGNKDPLKILMPALDIDLDTIKHELAQLIIRTHIKYVFDSFETNHTDIKNLLQSIVAKFINKIATIEMHKDKDSIIKHCKVFIETAKKATEALLKQHNQSEHMAVEHLLTSEQQTNILSFFEIDNLIDTLHATENLFDLKNIIKTHITIDEGKNLQPVICILEHYTEHRNKNKKLKKIYLTNNETAEDDYWLNQSLMDDIASHSELSEMMHKLHHQINDIIYTPDNLLGHINILINKLQINSTVALGSHENSGINACKDIYKFYEYYKLIKEAQKQLIPDSMRTEIDNILACIDQPKGAYDQLTQRNSNLGRDLYKTCLYTRSYELLKTFNSTNTIIISQLSPESEKLNANITKLQSEYHQAARNMLDQTINANYTGHQTYSILTEETTGILQSIEINNSNELIVICKHLSFSLFHSFINSSNIIAQIKNIYTDKYAKLIVNELVWLRTEINLHKYAGIIKVLAAYDSNLFSSKDIMKLLITIDTEEEFKQLIRVNRSLIIERIIQTDTVNSFWYNNVDAFITRFYLLDSGQLQWLFTEFRHEIILILNKKNIYFFIRNMIDTYHKANSNELLAKIITEFMNDYRPFYYLMRHTSPRTAAILSELGESKITDLITTPKQAIEILAQSLENVSTIFNTIQKKLLTMNNVEELTAYLRLTTSNQARLALKIIYINQYVADNTQENDNLNIKQIAIDQQIINDSAMCFLLNHCLAASIDLLSSTVKNRLLFEPNYLQHWLYAKINFAKILLGINKPQTKRTLIALMQYNLNEIIKLPSDIISILALCHNDINLVSNVVDNLLDTITKIIIEDGTPLTNLSEFLNDDAIFKIISSVINTDKNFSAAHFFKSVIENQGIVNLINSIQKIPANNQLLKRILLNRETVEKIYCSYCLSRRNRSPRGFIRHKTMRLLYQSYPHDIALLFNQIIADKGLGFFTTNADEDFLSFLTDSEFSIDIDCNHKTSVLPEILEGQPLSLYFKKFSFIYSKYKETILIDTAFTQPKKMFMLLAIFDNKIRNNTIPVATTDHSNPNSNKRHLLDFFHNVVLKIGAADILQAYPDGEYYALLFQTISIMFDNPADFHSSELYTKATDQYLTSIKDKHPYNNHLKEILKQLKHSDYQQVYNGLIQRADVTFTCKNIKNLISILSPLPEDIIDSVFAKLEDRFFQLIKTDHIMLSETDIYAWHLGAIVKKLSDKNLNRSIERLLTDSNSSPHSSKPWIILRQDVTAVLTTIQSRLTPLIKQKFNRYLINNTQPVSIYGTEHAKIHSFNKLISFIHPKNQEQISQLINTWRTAIENNITSFESFYLFIQDIDIDRLKPMLNHNVFSKLISNLIYYHQHRFRYKYNIRHHSFRALDEDKQQLFKSVIKDYNISRLNTYIKQRSEDMHTYQSHAATLFKAEHKTRTVKLDAANKLLNKLTNPLDEIELTDHEKAALEQGQLGKIQRQTKSTAAINTISA